MLPQPDLVPRRSALTIIAMDFAAWQLEVVRLIRTARPEFQESWLEPNTAYQAWASGVRADVFARNPTIIGPPLPPLTDLPARKSPVVALTVIGICVLLAFGLGVWTIRRAQAMQEEFWSQFNDMPMPTNVSIGDTSKSDATKLQEAADELSAWKGDDATYQKNLKLLDEIERESVFHGDAKELAGQWKAARAVREAKKAKAAKEPAGS